MALIITSSSILVALALLILSLRWLLMRFGTIRRVIWRRKAHIVWKNWGCHNRGRMGFSRLRGSKVLVLRWMLGAMRWRRGRSGRVRRGLPRGKVLRLWPPLVGGHGLNEKIHDGL